MALKPDFRHLDWTVEFYATGVMNKGLFLVHSNLNTGLGPSGASMDGGENIAGTVASPSGHSVLGCLFSEVVNKDLTQTHLDENRDEVNIGQKVSVITKGWVLTDKIQPGTSPSGGQVAYLGGTGYVTPTQPYVPTGVYDGGAALRNVVVGKFKSGKDADGYAKVEFNLP